MNTRLSEIVNEIENARTTLFRTVEGLSQKEFDKQPDSGQWSVGEILHHIYILENQVTKLLEKQVEKAKKRGIGPDLNTESLIKSLDRFAFETAETKLKAPSSVEPRQGIEKKKLIELLQHSRTALLEIVSAAGSYDLSELIFPHPILGRLNMYEWILLIGKHDDRHRTQIENILNQ
ncbi:MAG: DinB family protein [Candidatus Aminicenantes bacterium]|jgi:uncharacterized damage-inducible protein DinB